MKVAILLFFISVFSCNNYAADKPIYAWKDKNGVLVFSDTPKSGAKEIKLTTQNLTMPAIDTAILSDKQQKEPDFVKYKVMISSPQNDATIRENSGSVYVSSRVSPRFENGFTLQLFIDDSPFAPPSNTTTFALRNIYRGEHSLQVKLFDSKGNNIASSPKNIFYMHRASSL